MTRFKETEGVATTLSLGRREISHQRAGLAASNNGMDRGYK